eukprot:TRINITY_DN233_c1_g1_i3.p1 TRINITY_DN233_c1_g1~~TRINITY_DN233_c1_g1_i3.p1  ORF type:complete len:486 (+),score=218.46 TRINITY_DN233_c1_g1_i3:78-1460(+)
MSFGVSVGTDLFGTKRNIKLEFPRCPTMSELINAVESQYDVEMRASRPAGYPDIPFKVQTFQLYDDVLQRWVDLYSSAQLSSGCTVYCFQPESIWHSDAQGIIPDAAQTVTWTTPVGSPRRARIATDAGVAPTLSEKLRSVFYECDAGNKGYVLYSDLRAAFAKCDIEFTFNTVGELFTAADANRSGHITYDEWVAFAIKYPAIVDALFFRSRDVRGDPGKAEQVAPDDAARSARQAELRAMYERQQWAAPSPALQEQEAALGAQRAVATAAAARQAELQEICDQKAAQHAAAQQRLQELQAAADAQRDVAQREAQATQEAAVMLDQQKQVLQKEAARQAELQARVEQLKRQEAEAAERARQQTQRDAEEAQRQMALAESAQRAAQQRAAEIQAAEAARAQAEFAARQEAERQAVTATADYEAARREADAARMQKEVAEQRERQAWDRLYYQPNSPPNQY